MKAGWRSLVLGIMMAALLSPTIAAAQTSPPQPTPGQIAFSSVDPAPPNDREIYVMNADVA
jgi:hypothetical protein